MRWGPLLFLLLVGATFALSPVHTGKMVGTGLELREFGPPIGLDIDSDGKDEAFIWSTDGRTYLLDGKDLSSWKNFTGQIVGMAPLDDKVVVAETGNLHILGSYKKDLLGWPQEGDFTGAPVVADLDKDGVAEILVPTAQGLEIRHTYGPATLLPISAQKISVGDVNGDGKLEIAVTEKGKVHLFDSDYQEIDGWPKEIGGTLSEPTISGSNIAVSTSQGELYVWNADGSEVLHKATGQRSIYTDIPAPVFVEDLIILTGPENTVRAFRGETEAWSSTLENVTNLRFDPLAIDLEGDSEPEQIIPADFYLYILSMEGEILDVFQMDGTIKSPITLDLLDDEALEVLVVSEETFALTGDSLLLFPARVDKKGQVVGQREPSGEEAEADSGEPKEPLNGSEELGDVAPSDEELRELRDSVNEIEFHLQFMPSEEYDELIQELQENLDDPAVLQDTSSFAMLKRSVTEEIDEIRASLEENREDLKNETKRYAYRRAYVWGECEYLGGILPLKDSAWSEMDEAFLPVSIHVAPFIEVPVPNPLFILKHFNPDSVVNCAGNDLILSMAPVIGAVTDGRDTYLFCPRVARERSSEEGAPVLDTVVCSASAFGTVTSIGTGVALVGGALASVGSGGIALPIAGTIFAGTQTLDSGASSVKVSAKGFRAVLINSIDAVRSAYNPRIHKLSRVLDYISDLAEKAKVAKGNVLTKLAKFSDHMDFLSKSFFTHRKELRILERYIGTDAMGIFLKTKNFDQLSALLEGTKRMLRVADEAAFSKPFISSEALEAIGRSTDWLSQPAVIKIASEFGSSVFKQAFGTAVEFSDEAAKGLARLISELGREKSSRRLLDILNPYMKADDSISGAVVLQETMGIFGKLRRVGLADLGDLVKLVGEDLTLILKASAEGKTHFGIIDFVRQANLDLLNVIKHPGELKRATEAIQHSTKVGPDDILFFANQLRATRKMDILAKGSEQAMVMTKNPAGELVWGTADVVGETARVGKVGDITRTFGSFDNYYRAVVQAVESPGKTIRNIGQLGSADEFLNFPTLLKKDSVTGVIHSVVVDPKTSKIVASEIYYPLKVKKLTSAGHFVSTTRKNLERGIKRGFLDRTTLFEQQSLINKFILDNSLKVDPINIPLETLNLWEAAKWVA